jgi:hypothetical protein
LDSFDPSPDPLLCDVAQTAALIVKEDLTTCGVVPLDRIAHVVRAAIEAYLLFSARERPAAAGEPSPN